LDVPDFEKPPTWQVLFSQYEVSDSYLIEPWLVEGQHETAAYRQFGGRSFELRVPAFGPVWDPGALVFGTPKDDCFSSLSKAEAMKGTLE
jgi:hypothetical protein